MTAPLTSQERFVAVPGGELFMKTWRPAAASESTNPAPLVLLHDSIGSVEMWRDFPEKLCAALGRVVVAYDRLGFGRSSARVDTLTPRFVEEEAEVFFPRLHASLGGGTFDLFGHSVGGGMAVAIAAAFPAHCRAVVTESSQAFVEERTREGIRAAKADFADPAKLSKLARFHGAKTAWVLASWTETWLAPSFDGWSLRALLPRLRCPLLAIHGDRDEYGSLRFPETIASLAGGGERAVILADCGHVPHRENRAAVLAALREFLA